MSTPSTLESLLLEWEWRADRGERVTASDLCAGHPALLPELERQIAVLQSINARIGTPRDDQTIIRGSEAEWTPWRRSHSSTDQPERDPSGSLAPTPTSSGRFRKIHEHAQGGIGRVFVADDLQLHRKVALKEIRPDCDHRETRQRFIAEAEITGQLDHPNIVPVYCLERDAGQRPFYAMRWIQGRTLAEAIGTLHGGESDSRVDFASVEFRSLLTRFIAICQAVEFAHQRGVIHRDIKPTNIMLGEFGESLLVDWGLARILDSRSTITESREVDAGSQRPVKAIPLSESSSTWGNVMQSPVRATSIDGNTKHGDIVGTPVYMSPEQARGELKEVGPASDIYSLGATLFEVLTRQRPRRESSAEGVLQAARLGEVPRPRDFIARIPRPLEAICMRAMAVHPAGRYTSARGLIDDLERYLADDSVMAYRAPLAARVRRWARKHPAAMAASLATFVLLGICGMGFAWQQRVHSIAVGEINQKLVEQRDIAVTRGDVAIDATLSFVAAIEENDELKQNPSLADLRKHLLRQPMKHLQQIQAGFRLPSESPQSIERLGEVSFQIATLAYEIDDSSLASENYREAMQTFQGLVDASPKNASYQSKVANAHRNLGIMLEEQGVTAEAFAHLQRGQAMWKQLVDQHPEQFSYAIERAQSLTGIGQYLLRSGDVDGADTTFREVLSILEGLPEAAIDNSGSKSAFANAYTSLAVSMGEMGKLTESRDCHRRALDLRTLLAKETPEDLTLQAAMAASLGNLGYVDLVMGKPEEAIPKFQQAMTIAKSLSAAQPSSNRFQELMAQRQFELGTVLEQTKEHDQALEAFQSAAELWDRLHAKHPAVVEYAIATAKVHTNLNVVLGHKGKVNEAVAEAEKAVAIYQDLVKMGIDRPVIRSGWGASLGNLALSRFKRGEKKQAIEQLLMAIEQQQIALESNVDNPNFRRHFGSHYEMLMIMADDVSDLASVVRAVGVHPSETMPRPIDLLVDTRIKSILGGEKPLGTIELLGLASRLNQQGNADDAVAMWTKIAGMVKEGCKPSVQRDAMIAAEEICHCLAGALEANGEARDNAERYAEAALDIVERLHRAGFDVQEAATRPSLAPIASRDRLKQILATPRP
jgi:eukaryotic-like serine/threonine-protein kinase